jgi:hypothetical protein
MRFTEIAFAFIAFVLISLTGQALQAFSGDTISIDSTVADDIIAAGNMVSINAPVDSAIVAGGTVNVNAPVKGDVIAVGGQVYVNADVGGKVVAAGGNVNLGGNVGTNLVAAGGQVNILPGKDVGRDALIGGGEVTNAGSINGTITVHASQFNNTGSAGLVRFYKVEDSSPKKDDYEDGFNIFSLLSMLGYFILGLLLVRSMPGIMQAVDGEVRSSTLLKTLLGFVMIIAAFIALLLVAATVVGLPIAVIAALLFFAAIMLSGTFISFSLGKWIGERARINQGDLVYFIIGFMVLNVLSLLPFVGGLVSLVSMSLGFAAILYAARRMTGQVQAKAA